MLFVSTFAVPFASLVFPETIARGVTNVAAAVLVMESAILIAMGIVGRWFVTSVNVTWGAVAATIVSATANYALNALLFVVGIGPSAA